MYRINDKVVYPGHGVAIINRIIEKIVSSKLISFYELKFVSKDMTVLVPTHNIESIGIRPLCTEEKIKDIFKVLMQPARKLYSYEVIANNWNKRNKDYQLKLRTGNLYEISEIYRELKYIARYKELSFGEKNLLQQTEALLAEEISLVKKVDEERALEDLRAIFTSIEKTHTAVMNQKAAAR